MRLRETNSPDNFETIIAARLGNKYANDLTNISDNTINLNPRGTNPTILFNRKKTNVKTINL